MSGHSTHDRLDRLDQLQGLLKERDSVVLAELAKELGVSQRTISRDIALLRLRGLPVESDRGRGGGTRLAQAWSLGRIHLTLPEAIDTLLALAIAEEMKSPFLLQTLKSVRRKIAATFPGREETRIRQLRRRILIGRPASSKVMESYNPSGASLPPAIAMAFFQMRCLRIDYEDSDGRTTVRLVEPQFLLLNMPVWYLLAWDRLRDGIRFFRIDRIRQAVLVDAGFRLGKRDLYLAQADLDAQDL